MKKTLLITIFHILVTGNSGVIATDLDVFRSYEKNNVMMVMDTSGSMSWPVYNQDIDYGAFMRWMKDHDLAFDENDCRNGSDWWDLDGTGDDYDRLSPNHIYLVSTYVSYHVIKYIDSDKIARSVSVIDDVMTNTGHETDRDMNRRYALLTNAIIPVNNSSNNPLIISEPTSIDIDNDSHVLFPKNITADIEGKAVTVPIGIEGLRLPNYQDIRLLNKKKDSRTGEIIEKGFLGILKAKGFYFSGIFEKSGAVLSLTKDAASEAEMGYGGKRVYLFATGNWLNFIKLVEDFRVNESINSCTEEGYFSHQRYKAWQWVCYKAVAETGDKSCCSESESLGRIKSRIQVIKEAMKQVVEKTEQKINWGLVKFNNDSGGTVLSPLGSDITDIIGKIETLKVGGSSPLGEAIQDAYNHSALWLNKRGLSCALNYILIVTDGFSSQDDEWNRITSEALVSDNPNPIFGFCSDGYGSSCKYYGDGDSWPDNNFSDDIAHFLYNKATYRHSIMAIDFGMDSPILAEMAETSFGIHMPAFNQKQIINAFLSCGYAISSSCSFIPPVASLNPLTPVENGDDLYLTFFQPGEDFGWNGNLKKYSLKLMTRGLGDCGRTEPELVITDRNGMPAVDCNGIYKPTAVSLWSKDADGGYVTQGGAGQMLKNAVEKVDISAGPYYDFRNIYTCKDPSKSHVIERFFRDRDKAVPDTILPGDLGISSEDTKADFLERDRIINLVYGYTQEVTDKGLAEYSDTDDGNPTKMRNWILGDMIHSEPVIIDYKDKNNYLDYRFIAVGANDGMLHVFVETTNHDNPDMTVTINKRDYKPGDEIWAFIPGEFLPRLAELKDKRTHKYFVDGFLSLHRASTWNNAGSGSIERKENEYFDKILVFGQRRGGRCYWALDVSQPDPQKWSVKWRIKGGLENEDFSPDLGYTWSKPLFGSIRTEDASNTDVVIFGGGYDIEEDFFPEPWADGNNNGKYDRDNPEDYFDIHNANHDANDNDTYDTFNPDKNETGRGIFVVNLSDGSPVFKATFGIEAFLGVTQTITDMKWCFPADAAIINQSGTLLIYITDIYGQVWKVSYDYSRTSDKWQVKRIFQTNPGSGQPDAQTALNMEPSLNTRDSGRKSFYSPDISYLGTEWTDYPVLFFGTGDRVHPKYVPDYHNRFYVISDTDEFADETDLINLTCDELDRYADANLNKTLEYGGVEGDTDAEIQEGLINILYGNSLYPRENKKCRGWYRILGKQGECTQDTLMDHLGEMCLSQPTLFNKIVYFTTYQPTFDDRCSSRGNSFIYALDYSMGTAALDFNKINIAETLSNEGTLADTYQLIEKSGIVSSIRVIFKDGMTSAFVSGGYGIFPVGEEEGLGTGYSSTIPTLKGGTQSLLWEVY